jgi:4-diphosphocytidyl-2C-methyl-D-erythritol kinase
MQRVIKKSPGKLNLCLEVVEHYPNGFHGIQSVMTKTTRLADEVEIIFGDKISDYFRKEKNENSQKTKNDKDNLLISLTANHQKVPTNEENICWKIAKKFFTKIKRKVDLQINLTKNIPPLAGLGGGSSNGAITLKILNNFFQQPLTQAELIELAAEVGKDIPFFLTEKTTAYISGAGEKIQEIDNFPPAFYLIINPMGEISTPQAYVELDGKMWFMADQQRQSLARKMTQIGKDDQKFNQKKTLSSNSQLRNFNPVSNFNNQNSDFLNDNFSAIEKMAQYLYNDFSIVAEEKFPVILELKNVLRTFGAVGTSITGKGPTVFGIFHTQSDLKIAEEKIKSKYPDFFVVSD